MQIAVGRFVFHWRWKTLLLTGLLVMLFIRLGLWQWHKAEQRQAMHDALNGGGQQLVQVDAAMIKQSEIAQALHGRRVEMTGHYLPQYTVLLDNQVENGQAGFHVLTPLLLQDAQVVVWVNRGWVAGFSNHQQLPVIRTGTSLQSIRGLAWQIKKTAFQLGKPAMDWQPVQPVIDFGRLRRHVPYAMPTMIVKLDPATPQDGFVRHWQLPAGEIEKNLGYAYQWFGFAIAAVLIAGYQLLEKRPGAPGIDAKD